MRVQSFRVPSGMLYKITVYKLRSGTQILIFFLIGVLFYEISRECVGIFFLSSSFHSSDRCKHRSFIFTNTFDNLWKYS